MFAVMPDEEQQVWPKLAECKIGGLVNHWLREYWLAASSLFAG